MTLNELLYRLRTLRLIAAGTASGAAKNYTANGVYNDSLNTFVTLLISMKNSEPSDSPIAEGEATFRQSEPSTEATAQSRASSLSSPSSRILSTPQRRRRRRAWCGGDDHWMPLYLPSTATGSHGALTSLVHCSIISQPASRWVYFATRYSYVDSHT